MGPLSGNHYEILGIDARATPEQVEKAYRFALEIYGDGALATYSLLDAEDIRRARAQLRESYEVLSDPTRRIEYDRAHGLTAAGAPVLAFPASSSAPPSTEEPRPEAAPASEARPAQPDVLTEPVTGVALKRLREQRGITLRDIADASKVAVRYFEYIEADRHSLLPAPVYLRGFLQEYARALGLDPRRTAESYLARVPRSE